ncbi:MAG: hypothetical protein V9G10_07520 [Candidatus Nanopelagicales bacterium]
MRAGLVKSLVLDRRKEIGALPLEFKAERDDAGNPALSEGQRVMLRAGLKKLRKLEADFAQLDPARHPKMLVVCEDTTVSPLVAQFLQDQEGLQDDEVMTIDSGKKAELGEKDWAPVRQRLFSVDRHATPRVIVSVLMLREGFDVNNICVIVPLRSSQAQILLEQTIGRGLRLMWRDDEYTDLKRENRERINAGQEPGSLLDVLSIVEHPAFQSFYDELIAEGLAGTTGDDMDDTSATGDVIAAELREGFEAFDFGIPFILQEADELRDHHALDVAALPAFTAMSAGATDGSAGQGRHLHFAGLAERHAVWRLPGGRRGDERGRLQRVPEPLDPAHQPGAERAAAQRQQDCHAPGQTVPAGQHRRADRLAGRLHLDAVVWRHLQPAGRMVRNWRVLLLQPVVDHITKVFAVALLESEQKHVTGQTEVHQRRLSRSAAPDDARKPFGGSEQVHLHPPGLAGAQRRAGANLHSLGAGRRAGAGLLQDQRKPPHFCTAALCEGRRPARVLLARLSGAHRRTPFTWWKPRRSSKRFTPTCSASSKPPWPGATASTACRRAPGRHALALRAAGGKRSA